MEDQDYFGITLPVTITDFKFLGSHFRVNDTNLPSTGKIQEFW